MVELRGVCALGASFFLVSGLATADSWQMPEDKTHVSPSGDVRLMVFPRGSGSLFRYLADKARGREPAGPRPEGGRKECRGTLQARDDTGTWITRWERKLVNEKSPVEVLVADSGYVVTFDDWTSIGHGPNVVVIYAPDGSLVRQLALRDFLSEEHIEGLPRTVSSIQWGRGHAIADSGGVVRLRVREPAEDPYRDDARFRTVRLRLVDGELVESDGPGR